MRRAVFLDRDGVLNRAFLRQGKPYPPATLSQLRVLPGVRDACRRLHEAGFALILVTNQPDIARGTVTADEVSEMNGRLRRFLELDGVGVCPHDDEARCSCRKPKPGLLLEAARTWNLDLASSYLVGDRWRDIEAGHRAGCRTIFVDYGYSERRPDGPYLQVRSLREAANWILRTAQMSSPDSTVRTLRYA
ncbi:MAG TPA: HAD family hydrolase [Bryobacteraceae bacterium]|nr:HAD family hydrolase [Bryobacteraceae bacterium]